MSRTKKGAKRPGFEYQGARPMSWCGGYGKWIKKLTHKIERQRAKARLNDREP